MEVYRPPHGGNNRARTYDPLLVRQMLSQLSYAPVLSCADTYVRRRCSFYHIQNQLSTPFLKKIEFFTLCSQKKVLKTVDKSKSLCYNSQAFQIRGAFGGIAQLARAFGSYPEGRGFKSNFRYQPFANAKGSYSARWSSG